MRTSKSINQKQTNRANELKQEALKRAASGEAFPNSQTLYGRRILSYTTLTSKTYDPIFNHMLYEINPMWCGWHRNALKKQQVLQNKKDIRELALKQKQGQHSEYLRPQQNTKLGCALLSYLNLGSSCFDKDLFWFLRDIVPNWFGIGKKRC